MISRFQVLRFTRYLGLIGFLGIVGKPELRLFFLFYLLQPLIYIFDSFKKKENVKRDNSRLKNYYRTLFLSLFNPYSLLGALKQSAGQIVISLKYINRFPNTHSYKNKVDYCLPFRGTWTIKRGGTSKGTSHSWDILTQRYAYDFVMEDYSKKSFKTNGTYLGDYYCYNMEIISPADGIVSEVNDRINDYTNVGDNSIDWRTKDFRGNFVIIKHHESEYSFLAHLRLGSITVKKGQHVRRGDLVGLCGNSGHSTEPHLHFHIQDNKNFWIAMGLPVRFKDFYIESDGLGKQLKGDAFLEKDVIVLNKN